MSRNKKLIEEANQGRFDEGEDIGKLNEVKIVETVRPNGTVRIQQDFSNCPSLAEQHTAHLTDINYLIQKYKPDELGAYLAARAGHRAEILGHDFSRELSLQDAKNVVYESRKEFEKLPDSLKRNFANHLEFLKFIDNPENEEKMYKLGLLTKAQVEKLKIEADSRLTPTPTPTQEKEKAKE